MLVFILLSCPVLAAGFPSRSEEPAELAAEAFIYGYPLLMMEATRQTMTAPAEAGGPSLVNRFSHARSFPDHSFTDVVSPNADTLYSKAWLDLKDSPVILELPEMGQRYYLMQFMDGWTNDFISLGTRSTGNRPGAFFITGPGWQGEIPPGLIQVKSPTNMVWILGRIQTNGPADYAAVHALQDQFRLRPLLPGRDFGGADSGPTVPPLDRVEGLTATDYFTHLNRLMTDNPPRPADRELLDQLAAFNIGPGLVFDLSVFDKPTAEALESGFRAGLAKVRGLDGRSFGRVSGGWNIPPSNIGDYGTDYCFRAFTARYGLGANLPEDAVYPAARIDAQGRLLSGGRQYTIRFVPGQLPPVRAFWSITLYDHKQRFAANSLNRHVLGDRDPLRLDPDGGLTLYLQPDSPGPDRQANWLPTPAGDFNLMMRLYWPEPPILDGSWAPPQIESVED